MIRRRRDTVSGAECGPSLDEHLGAYRSETGAELVVLVDPSGHVVATVGEYDAIDTVVLASLVTAYLGAALRLATLLKGMEFKGLLHQGTRTTVRLSLARGDWTIAEVYSGARPGSGITADTEGRVVELEKVIEETVTAAPPSAGSDSSIEDWTSAAESALDRLFGGEG